jgi:hypothetical protein
MTRDRPVADDSLATIALEQLDLGSPTRSDPVTSAVLGASARLRGCRAGWRRRRSANERGIGEAIGGPAAIFGRR